VGVARKGEGKLGGNGRVERVRMMREKNGESFRIAQRDQFGEGGGDGGIVITGATAKGGAAPAQTEELHGIIARGELRGFVDEERDAGCFDARFEGFAALKQIVVAFDHVNAGTRVEPADGLDAFGDFMESAVDQVAGEKDEVGSEIVDGGSHLAKDGAAGEPAGVHVAHMGDGQAVERGWEIANGDRHPADAKLFELAEGDRGQADGEKLRSECRGGGEESAATHAGVVGVRTRSFARLEFANHPANKSDDNADYGEREDERQDEQMPKVNGSRDEPRKIIPKL